MRRNAIFFALLLAFTVSISSAQAGAIASDLVLTKTDSADPVAVGDTLDYILSIQNVGLNAASGVVVTDTLPAGTGWIVTNAPAFSGCTNPGLGNSGVVQCSLPTTLAAGATVTVTITVAVESGAPAGSLSNSATVTTSGTLEATPADNTDVETTTVLAADLAVTKVDTIDTVAPGDPLEYTISLINNGPGAASNVIVSDALPATTTFVSLVSPAGFTCTTPVSGGTGTVSCTNPTFAAGATATFVLTVNTTVPAAINNTVTVTSDVEADPSDNSDTESSLVALPLAADVSVAKAVVGGPVTAGSNVTFTITVTNNGPDVATAVTVNDPVPAGTTFVSATPSQGSCTSAVVCSLGDIAAAGTATITLVVQSSAVAGTITNTATVSSSTPDPAPLNNSATALAATLPPLPPPAVGTIPTLSGWMLILLAASLALAGVFVFKN